MGKGGGIGRGLEAIGKLDDGEGRVTISLGGSGCTGVDGLGMGRAAGKVMSEARERIPNG